MTLKTFPFDESRYLDDAQSQAELVHGAFESGDAKFIALALGVVARARGMTSIAEEAGISRDALYAALKDDEDPDLATLLAVAKALSRRHPADKEQSPSQAAE